MGSKASKLQVQVHAHGRPIDYRIEMLAGPNDDATGRGGIFRLRLSEPLRGAAPGQIAVLYHIDTTGNCVSGSGTIISTAREEGLS